MKYLFFSIMYHNISSLVSIRLTNIFVSLLSLQLIPLPVLYGIFLFMGVRALSGMQVMSMYCEISQRLYNFIRTTYCLKTCKIVKRQITLTVVKEFFF